MENRLQEIEARKLEIREEVESTEEVEKIEELDKEVDALNEEVKEITDREEQEKMAEEVQEEPSKAEEVSVVEEIKKGGLEMETRNTKEYINAYAEYVKTGKDEEVRALLSENVNTGTIAVPDFVLDEVKTAWEKSDLLALVRRTNMRGNLKVQFEVSGSPAVVHTEGGNAVAEEELVEGIVEITPVSIKKWISISDEVMDLRGEEFLRYIYDELTYKIAKKAADTLVTTIAALPATATASSVSANKVDGAIAMGTIATAIANLSDEAENPVIVMNKLTYANFKAVQYANGFGADPFEGLRVIYNNTLPSYDSAAADAVYAIVGDFGHGAIANFPNGEGVEIKVDELSRKKEDLVEILGREYVGLGVVADKAFALLTK